MDEKCVAARAGIRNSIGHKWVIRAHACLCGWMKIKLCVCVLILLIILLHDHYLISTVLVYVTLSSQLEFHWAAAMITGSDGEPSRRENWVLIWLAKLWVYVLFNFVRDLLAQVLVYYVIYEFTKRRITFYFYNQLNHESLPAAFTAVNRLLLRVQWYWRQYLKCFIVYTAVQPLWT